MHVRQARYTKHQPQYLCFRIHSRDTSCYVHNSRGKQKKGKEQNIPTPAERPEPSTHRYPGHANKINKRAVTEITGNLRKQERQVSGLLFQLYLKRGIESETLFTRRPQVLDLQVLITFLSEDLLSAVNSRKGSVK